MKKGKVYSIDMKSRTEKITGVVEQCNAKWIVLRYIPVDYVLDGFMIINRSYVKKTYRSQEDKFVEGIVGLKKGLNEISNIDASNNKSLLTSLQKKGIIQFDLKDESITFVGRIIEFAGGSFKLESLTSKGKWMGIETYRIDKVRSFQVGTDYIESLFAYNRFIHDQKVASNDTGK